MNGSCLDFRRPIGGPISRIRFAPQSNNLLISSWDSILRLYDVDKCELRLETSGERESLIDCCFESESVAVSSNCDGSILRYDLHLGNSKTIGSHGDSVTCVEYSDETCQLVSGGWDKSIKFWDVRSASSSGCLSNLIAGVESMSVSGYDLAVALKSSLNTYDLRNLDTSVQVKEPFMGIPIKCVRASSDLEGVVVGSNDGRVALEFLGESNSKNEGYAFRCHPKDKNGRQHIVNINDIAFNPSTRGVVVTGDNDGNAAIWDVLNRKRLVELPRCPNSIASLAYNHGGQLLAVASSFTYQEGDEREDLPRIFVHQADDRHFKSVPGSISKIK